MNLLINAVIFGMYAIFSGAGLIVLKTAMTENPPELSKLYNLIYSTKFLVGFLLYAAGFLTWMFILSKFRLNFAFPISISLFFIVLSLGSYFFLKETFGGYQIIGTILCLSGILLVSLK